MVGHSVRCRVVRRNASGSGPKSFFYSTATKGPISISDETTREVLKILVQPDFKVEIQFPREELQGFIYGLTEHHLPDRPFVDGYLHVERMGVRVVLTLWEGGEVERNLKWTEFAPSRPSPADVEVDPSDDLYLFVEAMDWHDMYQGTFHLALPNEKERNEVYHAIAFYRLSGGFKGFERWRQDLDRGNWSVFKQRYAQLWADTSWDDFQQISIEEGFQENVYSQSQESYEAGKYQGGDYANSDWNGYYQDCPSYYTAA